MIRHYSKLVLLSVMFIFSFLESNAQKKKRLPPILNEKFKQIQERVSRNFAHPFFNREFSKPQEKKALDIWIDSFFQLPAKPAPTPHRPLYTNGFAIGVADFFSLLDTLKINGKSTSDTVYTIRFYPATDVNDNFYIVMIGEYFFPTETDSALQFKSMIEGSYCILRSNFLPYTVISDQSIKVTINNEIKAFQNKYLQYLKVKSYTGKVDSAKAAIFKLFNNNATTSGKKNAIAMIPGFDKITQSLKFIWMGQTGMTAINPGLVKTKSYFDEMDECPTKCPTSGTIIP